MKNERKNVPFFARFLENQQQEEVKGGATVQPIDTFDTTKFPSDNDEYITLKYPSDEDEQITLKYPSDEDEPSDITLKYPSDNEEFIGAGPQ